MGWRSAERSIDGASGEGQSSSLAGWRRLQGRLNCRRTVLWKKKNKKQNKKQEEMMMMTR